MDIKVIFVISVHMCLRAVTCEAEHRQFPNLYALDDYDPCLREDNGLYCVARFELFAAPGNQLMARIKEHAQDTCTHYNYSKIERGTCITQSCKKHIERNGIDDAAGLRASLEECVNETVWKENEVNAKLVSIYYCDRYNEKSLRIDRTDVVVAGLFTFLLSLVIIGSYHDFKIRNKDMDVQNSGSKYLLCFSVFQNFRSLSMDDTGDPRFKSLKGLHGIRTFVIATTIYAHMFLLICTGFMKDPDNFEKTYDNMVHHLVFNGLMVVQVFFFMSGFMLAYILKHQEENRTVGWSSIPKIMAFRWWRLTPVCAAMVAFFATWMRHLGSGPLWKFAVTNTATAYCRKYWWAHLLYINNFFPDNKYCVLPSWHIAADMQMFLLCVIVHVATKNGKRFLIMSLLLMLGMLTPAVHIWLYDTDALTMVTPESLRVLLDDTFFYVHIRGYTNLPCFILGMTTGYMGYRLQKKRVDLSNNNVLKLLSWTIIPLVIGLILSGRMFYTPEMRASVTACMLYAATHRAVMGLILAVWVLSLICGCNDASRVLYSWRGFVLTSKLSYCVYLFHMFFYHFYFGIQRELIPVSIATVVFTTIKVIMLSYIIAVPMYLTIEAPFSAFVKTLVEDLGLVEKKIK